MTGMQLPLEVYVREEHEGMPLSPARRKAVNDLNELVYFGRLKLQINGTCFCGQCVFQQLSRLDRFGLPFGTQICRSCGLISQTLSLTEDSLPLFYDKVYWPLINGEAAEDGYATDIGARSFCEFVVPETRNRFSRKLSILEVGCGQGDRITSLARGLAPDYELELRACDFSRSAILAAERRGLKVLHGGLDVFLGSGQADVVILSHLFEHVVDLNRFLDQLEALVHDATLVYVEVPGVLDLKNKPEYEYDYQDYCVLAHIHNFSLTTLSGVFATRGFKAIKGTEFVRMLASRSGVAIARSSNPYGEILNGLREADEQHRKWAAVHRNGPRRYLASVVKACLNRL